MSSFGIGISSVAVWFIPFVAETKTIIMTFHIKTLLHLNFRFMVPISFTKALNQKPGFSQTGSKVKNDETSFGIRGPFQSVSVSDF